MFLATSALREFWDETEESLLLGPWCLRAGEIPGPRQKMLACPWDDRARLDAGLAHCQKTHLRLIELLADYLDAVLGLSLGRRYWHILLGPWAMFYTHQNHIFHARLSDALRDFPGLKSLLLSENDYYVPWDSQDFLRFLRGDRFNLQIASHILRAMGGSFPKRPLPAPNVAGAPPPCSTGSVLPANKAAQALRASFTRLADWGIRHAPCEVLTDELYPMGRLIWRLMAAKPLRLWPLRGSLPESLRRPALLDDRRKGLAGLPFTDEFGRILAASLPRALPSLFLEGFPAARDHVQSRLGRTPRLVLAGSQLYYNDCFKLSAAELSLRGSRLVGFQHGGAYGTTKAAVAEAHERKVTDSFMTWGWSSTEGDPSLLDVPAPNLSELLRRKPLDWRARDGILYATTEGFRCPHHLFHSPAEQQWEEFFLWRDRFLRAVDPKLFSLLSLRLHVLDFGWGLREALQKDFPGLRQDDHAASYLKRLGQVRLVVTDHPTTAFLEALALGLPSVHFWREDRWEIRAAAKPHFDALREVGIVHADPESAARHLAQIYADPGPWWESEAVHRARDRFVRLFARTNPDWVSAWVHVIESELAKTQDKRTRSHINSAAEKQATKTRALPSRLE